MIASLPVTLRPDVAGTDLVAISGGPGWVTAALAAIDGGARGLVVVAPIAEDAAELNRVAFGHRVPVVIDWPFAANPAVVAATGYFADLDSQDAPLECTVTVRTSANLSCVLLDQLALARALGRQILRANSLDWNSHGYVVMGRTAQRRRVRLAVVCTNAQPPTARVRLLGTDGSVELLLPSPETATPGRVTVTTPEGANLLPTLFETAHRFSWRRLTRLVHDDERAEDLTRFSDDYCVAMALTGVASGP